MKIHYINGKTYEVDSIISRRGDCFQVIGRVDGKGFIYYSAKKPTAREAAQGLIALSLEN